MEDTTIYAKWSGPVHTWPDGYLKENADADKHYHVCDVCGTKGEGEAHTWNVEAATEETDKHCTVCGYVIQDKLEHTHKGTLVSGKPATCTEEGSREYYSCDCGKYFEDKDCTKEITDLDSWKVIPKLEHSYKDGVCTVCGADEPTKPSDTKDPEDQKGPTASPKPTSQPDSETTSGKGSPETGDGNDDILPLVLMVVLAGGAVTGITVYRRKKN